MHYKIIGCDIDGTLLNKDRELSRLTVETIQRIKDDVRFILASSRMPQAMRHLQLELGIQNQPLICYNGALITTFENGMPIHSESVTIPFPEVQTIMGIGSEIQLHVSLYEKDDWFVPEFDYWANREQRNTKVRPEVLGYVEYLSFFRKNGRGAHKIMCMGEENKIDLLLSKLPQNLIENLHLYRSKPTYLEIAPKSISKGSAFRYLLDQYNTPHEHLLVFGDNVNDLSMFREAGYGVAVGNATPELLDEADDETKTNKEDGVALMIRQLFPQYFGEE